MEGFHAAVFFGVLTGLVSSGLIAALWEMAFDESPKFKLLLEPDFLTPLKVIAVVLSAPMMVMSQACWWLIARPGFGAGLFALGLLWSFFQGVFILTQVFNIP
jgi:hypothetical protein